MGEWTFFSNYGHVLVCLAKNRQVRLRDVAFEVGITERAVQKIVRDLQEAGFLTVSKQGRCNRYKINKRKSLRHSLESSCTVGKLLALVTKPGTAQPFAETEEKSPVGELVHPTKSEPAKPEPEKAEAAAPKPPAKPEPEPQAKPEPEPKPLDTRQQGSLF